MAKLFSHIKYEIAHKKKLDELKKQNLEQNPFLIPDDSAKYEKNSKKWPNGIDFLTTSI